MATGYTLAALAERFSVELSGDPDCIVDRVADLASATDRSISFLSDRRFKSLLEKTHASAVILSKQDLEICPKPALVTENPYLLYAKIATFLHPDEDLALTPGIHATAVVDPAAKVDASAIIAPNVVVEERVTIGPRSYIGPGSVLKRGVVIGSDCKLAANVTVCAYCKIGDRVLIHPAAVIGSDGFGFAKDGDNWVKIPQLGIVTVGNDVEVGAGVAIDRGAINNTVIGNGVKLDNQIHIAHNVTVGSNTAMAAQSGVAGSTKIGENCSIGGSVGILGHLEITAGTYLNAFSQVSCSIEQPGSYASGAPLESSASWRRNRVRMKQLDEMAKRIRALEKKFSEEK